VSSEAITRATVPEGCSDYGILTMLMHPVDVLREAGDAPAALGKGQERGLRVRDREEHASFPNRRPKEPQLAPSAVPVEGQ